MHSFATYQLSVSRSATLRETTCRVQRTYGAGQSMLVTVKRDRDAANAVREALRDVRMLRRGGMLVKC